MTRFQVFGGPASASKHCIPKCPTKTIGINVSERDLQLTYGFFGKGKEVEHSTFLKYIKYLMLHQPVSLS